MRISQILQEHDITQIIRQQFSLTGYDEPHQVNDGYCDWFADRIVNALGGETPTTFATDTRNQVDMDRLGQTYDPTAPLHVFVAHNGLIYDCEAPEGVDRWQDLPFYQRHSW